MATVIPETKLVFIYIQPYMYSQEDNGPERHCGEIVLGWKYVEDGRPIPITAMGSIEGEDMYIIETVLTGDPNSSENLDIRLIEMGGTQVKCFPNMEEAFRHCKKIFDLQ